MENDKLTNGFFRSWPKVAALAALLIAHILRVWGTSRLHFWGDSAYSVYSAQQNLLTIARERLTDGHPPFYYYLLHFWINLAGDSEVAVRYLSLIPGVLLVALVYHLGARAVGPSGGALAALFASISPFLVYYSRLPRMYSLLAFMALLSLALFLELHRKGGKGIWTAYSLSLLLTLYTHYYGLVILLAQGVLALGLWKQELGSKGAVSGRSDKVGEQSVIPWVRAAALSGALFAPWFFFAFPSSAQATGKIISNAPPAPNLAALFEQLWLVFLTGEMIDVDQARIMAWGLTGALVGSFLLVKAITRPALDPPSEPSLRAEERGVSSSNNLRNHRESLYLIFFLTPIIAVIPIYILFPYFVWPRFLIFLGPAVPLALVWALLKIPHTRVRVPLAALAALTMLYSLKSTFWIESNIVEADAIQLTQYLKVYSTPGDGAIFQAFWQLGYLESRLGSAAPVRYALRDVSSDRVPGLLQKHRKLWLVMYNVSPYQPQHPMEEWLDRNAYKSDTKWFGPSRISLYSWPDQDLKETPQELSFGKEIQLLSYSLSDNRLKAKDVLEVGLRLQALGKPDDDYSVFSHLIDSNGQRQFGQDSEPINGLLPTSQWQPGQEVVTRYSLQIPPSLPWGTYYLIIGLYHQPSGKRLVILDKAGRTVGDAIFLSSINVEGGPTLGEGTFHPTNLSFGNKVTLVGYALVDEQWQPGDTKRIQTPTGVVVLTFPAHGLMTGNNLRLSLHWRVEEILREDLSASLRILDPQGRIRSQVNGLMAPNNRPTSLWTPREVVHEETNLSIESQAPPGSYRLQLEVYPPTSEERLPPSKGSQTEPFVTFGEVFLKSAGAG